MEVWQQVAQGVLSQWDGLSNHVKGSPVQTLQMLQKCGDQQLKARIVGEKGEKGANVLNELNQWRESLFSDKG